MWFRFILFNVCCILFLFVWATDDDIKGLPSDPIDRLVALMYYTVTIMTTTGYGDITANSSRARVLVTIYMLVNFYILVTQISIFRSKHKAN
jgi:energy-converting hydrogenase Eha subunit C